MLIFRAIHSSVVSFRLLNSLANWDWRSDDGVKREHQAHMLMYNMDDETNRRHVNA